MKIAELLLRMLEENGVRHIFGNPGTTEIPLVRMCERRRDLRYIVALSEVAAVPMADGYARATRSLGVVNLHVAPGLGNGMGALYTAGIAQTPLLVLVGGQDRRLLHTQPILWGPLERMAASVLKDVFTLSTRTDAAAHIRRALRSALTPPFGPVALICPPDLLEENLAAKPARVQPPALGALGDARALEYVKRLRRARRPAFIAAEDVHWSNAGAALEQLAALCRAPVYVAPYTGALPVSSNAPCYAGYLPPSRKQIGERLSQHDLLCFVGGTTMRTTLYSEATGGQPRLWIGTDPGVVAADGEFELATLADPGTALRELAGHMPRQRNAPKQKSARMALELPAQSAKVLHPSRAVHALLEAFPDALWVDESGLSTSDVRQWMRLPAGDYLINGSGGIGWGLAAAVGAAIACPSRQVVAIIGDGSTLYASEALWTAAHHGTHLLLVVLSNRRYATLNEAASRLTGHALDLFTIEPPVIDFSGLATLYGWAHVRVTREPELAAGLAGLGGKLKRNTLLEIVLDPAVKPVTAARHF